MAPNITPTPRPAIQFPRWKSLDCKASAAAAISEENKAGVSEPTPQQRFV